MQFLPVRNMLSFNKEFIIIILTIYYLGANNAQHIKKCEVMSVQCIYEVLNGKIDFALLDPQEALLASSFVSDKLKIVGEVHKKVNGSIPSHFNLDVVIKSDNQGGLANLKGKKYCHPGFKHEIKLSHYVLESLENKLLASTYDCQSDITIAERKIKALSEFFGPSCRPGQWTVDPELDAQLKLKYPNLCELCGPNKCETSYENSFNDSLNYCLLDNDADVAVMSSFDLDHLDEIRPNKYTTLCRNGETRALRGAFCPWNVELFSVIVGTVTEKSDVVEVLRKYYPDETDLQKNFQSYFGLTDDYYVETLSTSGLHHFLSLYKSIPDIQSSKICNESMRWCTRNEAEQTKCQWLSQAALNEGIQPVMECIQSNHDSDLSCINDIKSSKSDVFTLDSNHAYTAAKHNLTTIAYAQSDNTSNVRLITVVLSYTNNAQSFKDLEGQRACIPEFGGEEWFIFASFLRQKKLITSVSSDYGEIIGNFLGHSCIPGTKESRVTDISDDSKDNLCELCTPTLNTLTAKYCNADTVNRYYGNEGALRCVIDGVGDFAVLTTKEIPKETAPMKILCKNDKVKKINPHLVDEDCALDAIIDSQIITRPNDSKNKDYVLALKRLAPMMFGKTKQTPFNLFDYFNNTKNLVFKDYTPGLHFTSSDVYVDNLKKLVAGIDDAQFGNADGKLFSSLTVLLFSILCFLFVR